MKRRTGIPVVSARLMMRDFTVNKDKVYVAGISGGARTANSVAFLHPDLFSGAILTCGAGFPHKVKAVKTKDIQEGL
jgi:predicted peptidase